jgi:hypothetical protein
MCEDSLPPPKNSYQIEYNGGDSKFLNSFVIEPIEWLELLR